MPSRVTWFFHGSVPLIYTLHLSLAAYELKLYTKLILQQTAVYVCNFF